MLILLLALALTWPWARHPLTTMIAASADGYGGPPIDTMINMTYGGWMKLALLDLHRWPFAHTPWLCFPDGAAHGASFDSPMFALITGFLYLFLPINAAYSAALLLAFILCGLACYLYAVRRWGTGALAVAVALAGELCPFIFQRIMGHANLVYIWTLPAAILLFDGFAARPGRIRRGWWGWVLSFPLLALSSWYILITGLVFQGWGSAVLLGRWLGRRRVSWRARRRLLVRVALGWAVGLALVLAIAWPMVKAGRGRQRIGVDEMARYSTPLAQFLMPFPGGWAGHQPAIARLQAAIGTSWEAHLGLSPLCLGLFLIYLLRRRPGWERPAFLLTALSVTLIVIGPYLQLGRALEPGEGVTMPFYWLARWVPGFSVYKVPARAYVLLYFIALFAAGSVLQAVRERWLREGWRRRAAWPLLLVAFVAFHVWWGPPLGVCSVYDKPPVSAFYEQLAHAGGQGAILDVPFDDYHTPLYGYYQLFHKRPIVAATLFHDAVRPRSHRFINRHPELGLLRSYNSVFMKEWAFARLRDPGFMADLAAHGIEYLVVHPFYMNRLTLDLQLAAPTNWALVTQIEPAWRDRLVYQDSEIRVYRTK